MKDKVIPYIDRQSVLKYLGYKGGGCDEKTARDIEKASRIVLDASLNLCIYKYFDDISSFAFEGRDIRRHLEDCTAVVLTAVTLGAEVERVIRAASVADVREALIIDACASVCVESLNDTFIAHISIIYTDKGFYVTKGYAPGYGDLDINFQRKLAKALDIRKIGLTVSEDCLLIPRKSCMSIVGVSSVETAGCLAGCDGCRFSAGCEIYAAGSSCRR